MHSEAAEERFFEKLGADGYSLRLKAVRGENLGGWRAEQDDCAAIVEDGEVRSLAVEM